jgi:RNA polymerase sigma-70 factor (ECF subfamily)
MPEVSENTLAGPPDDHLMDRVGAGDLEALGELAERHKDGLVNYLTRLTGSRERGEDLAQEAFLRLFGAAQRYRGDGRFPAYLYRIATNLARSEQRRDRRWRQRLPVLLGGHGHDPESTAPARLLRSESRRLIAEAISVLPLRLRVPLVLHELEGWSYQAIAELLSVSEGTVKSRIFRGREKLRQRLAPYWNGGPP